MDKNKVIESAAKLIAKGQFEKAVKEYQRILDEDPDDVRVLQKLAELYQKMQRKEEAADCFEKVARTYAAQGFYLKAVALYKQVLKVVERIEVNVKLAELYQQLGLVGDATKEWQNVAGFYEKKGDVKQSLEVLKKLVDLDGDNVAARIRLGEAYARQEQNAQAVQELRRAAHYLKRNGRTDDYLRVAERISHLDPSDVALAKDLAEIYLGKADSKRALSKLQICFKSNPRDVVTLQLLARAFQDLGQVSKTVSVLKELARVHVDANAPDEARKAYRQALELQPEDAETRQALRALEPPPVEAEPPPQPRTPTPARGARPVAPARLATPPVVSKPPPPPPSDLTPMPASDLDAVLALAQQSPHGGTPVPILEPPARRALPKPPTDPGGAPPSVAKLLKETDVYLKYRLFEKAFEHIGKILALDGDNPEAHEKAKAVALATGRTDEAVSSMAALVRIWSGKDEARAEVAREELRAAAPDHPALSGARAAEPDEAVDEAELHELAEEASGEILAEVAPANEDSVEVEIESAEIHEEAHAPRAHPEPSDIPTSPEELEAVGPGEDAFASDLAEADFYLQQGLADDARAILEGILLSEPDHAEANRRLQNIEASDSGHEAPEITLLDARPVSSAAASHGDDMAAELARELLAEAGASGVSKPDGTPLDVLDPFQVPAAEVAASFRAKVQQVIRPEDVQTHFDLGIAYKEMGLTDEAIGEFEVALKHGKGTRAVDGYTMLGQCMLEKGEPEAAIGHYQSALAEPACTPGARLALSFEIGAALEALGRDGEALEAFTQVHAQDPRFRDVAARVERLGIEVTARSRAAARAAQPLLKKTPTENGQEGDHVVSSPVETGPQGEPAAAGTPKDARRNRKIGFV